MKTVIVTGAGSGMGAATATALAEAGYAVVCLDVSDELATRTAERLPAASAVAADVREPAEFARALDTAGHDLWGLVHAAGILTGRPALDLPLDEWRHVIDVNLTGTFVAVQATARRLTTLERAGSIVTFASIESEVPVVGHAHYAASKGGVLLLTRAFAVELARHGIRVNAVAPGVIDTPMIEGAMSRREHRDAIAGAIPMARAGHPGEVASACAFLLSEQASYVTGACLRIDGGALSRSPF